MARNLTQGSIVKTLVLFSLPLILSGLLQQLYNWADAFIVGNVEWEIPLAAIGATASVSNLLVMLITGFTVGTTILTARLYGSGETEKIRDVLSSFTLVLGGLFLAASLLGAVLTKPIMELLRTPQDIMADACSYLRIVFTGIPFIAVYNVYAAVLRGMGDSRTPFLAIVVSALTNVLLDILLVAVWHYGAAGAAVATVVSQALMAIFVVAYSARRNPHLRFRPGKAAVSREMVTQGLRLSIPTATQSSLHSVGNLILQNFMNGFGTATVAAITTAYRIDSIIMLPMNNLAAGVSTFTAQNVGADNPRRARRGLLVGTVLIAVVSVVLTLVVIPTGGTLIALFGMLDEVVGIGENFFRIIALFYLPFGIAIAIKGYLEGVGDVIFSGVASVLSLLIRIVLSYAFADIGSGIIAYAEAFSWLALLLMCAGRFLYMSSRKQS